MKRYFILLLMPATIGFAESSGWHLFRGYANYLTKIPPSVLQSFYFKSTTPAQNVALTFDDGPLSNTKELLHVLSKKKSRLPSFWLQKI